MKMHHIAKYNRKQAAGTPLPLATPQLHFWLALYQSKLSAHELGLISLLWLQGEFSWLKGHSAPPRFHRRSSSQPMESYGIRITRQGNQSWVEYACFIQIQGHWHGLWIPVPRQLNQLFLTLFRKKSYGVDLFTANHWEQVRQVLSTTLRRTKQLRHCRLTNKRQWQSYIIQCAHADETLSATGRAALIGEYRLQHRAITHYQESNNANLRGEIHQSLNRYLQRITDAAVQLDQLKGLQCHLGQDTIGWDADHLPLPLPVLSSAHLERDKTAISSRKLSEARYEKVGNRHIPPAGDVRHFLSQLRKDVKTAPGRHTSKQDRAIYHNKLVGTLALHLIALTGIRPTHAIGPRPDQLDSQQCSLSDKGSARTVLLPAFALSHLTHYQRYCAGLSQVWPELCRFPALFFYFDDDLGIHPLTPRWLRLFMAGHWPGHVPYQLRKSFAQSLTDLHCPSHILARLMGHHNYGEQAGAVSLLAVDEQHQRRYLEELSAFYRVERFL